MGDDFEQLLLPDGLAAARAALVVGYEWFTHVSTLDAFETIKQNGLHPRNPGCVAPIEVTRILGPGSEHILCLKTYPKKRILNLAKDAPCFKMAVSRDLLPMRIGVDWSFGFYRADLNTKRSIHPNWPIERVFWEHVVYRESIVSYDGIPASALRVCPKHAPDSPPNEWPEIVTTNRDDVYALVPDLLGNVQV